MRAFIHYFLSWLRSSSRPALVITLFFVASLVAANYTFGIEQRIQALPWHLALAGFFVFFSVVLALVWGLQYEWGWKEKTETPVATLRGGRIRVNSTTQPQTYFKPRMVLLLALATLFFSLKMVHWDLLPLLPRTLVYPWNRYTLLILQLPLKLILLFFFLYFCWKTGLIQGDSFAGSVGLEARGFKPAPYFGLLLLLVPLIALASFQHDFLAVYPKVGILSLLTAIRGRHGPGKQCMSSRMVSTSSASNYFSAGCLLSVCCVMPVQTPYFQWPPSTAPSISASRWENASPLFSED